MELYLNEKLGKITYKIDDTPVADAVLIIGHGAGAGMNHPFMEELAQRISGKGVSVVRFNFPYMEQGRKAPGSPKDAQLCWEKIIEEIEKIFHNKQLFISGKSYGGRMASHLLAENPHAAVSGILYFGFPLHAPGRDSKDRAAHLSDVKVPQLFIQGTNDKLANHELMKEVIQSLDGADLIEIEKGDHSFKTPKAIASKEEVIEILAEESVSWIQRR